MKIFTNHPNSIGETYSKHLVFALSMGLQLMGAGIACMIHGILPFLFQTRGSDAARKILSDITQRQQKQFKKSAD